MFSSFSFLMGKMTPNSCLIGFVNMVTVSTCHCRLKTFQLPLAQIHPRLRFYCTSGNCCFLSSPCIFTCSIHRNSFQCCHCCSFQCWAMHTLNLTKVKDANIYNENNKIFKLLKTFHNKSWNTRPSENKTNQPMHYNQKIK